MSSFRCSRTLFRPVRSNLCFPARSRVRPIQCRILRVDCQTRDKHNQPPRPSQPVHGQPTLEQSQQPQTQYEPIDEDQHQYTGEEPQFPRVRIRFLRPAIFAFSISSGAYVLLAYLEAREELKPKKLSSLSGFPEWQPRRQTPPTPTEVVTRAWTDLNPMSKLSWGIIGANGAVHLTKFLVPGVWSRLWHTPATNANYSLLTSTFVHSGPFHLFFNMWACYNFLPPVGYSRLFRGDTYHALSFFLSAGLLSGWAQHAASAVFKQGRAIPSIFIPSGGASGALFAMFGAFCMQYPQQGVGIVFVPFYVDAQYFLPAIMLFDFVGMVRGYSFVSFGHAAHLAGASIGAAYSYLDSYTHVWRPLVGFWKRRLQN